MLQNLSSQNSNNELDLRLIERSFPVGTIYTIYSLNLRYLFKINKEEELSKDIEILRFKSKVVTWLKARYLQKDFEENQSDERSKLIFIFEDHSEQKVESEKEQKIADEVFEKFVEHLKILINLEGENFYFLSEDGYQSNNYICEFDDEKVDEKETLFKILYDFYSKLTKIEEENSDKQKEYDSEKNLIETRLKDLLNKAKSEYKNKCNIKKIIKELNDLHSNLNKKKREKKNDLYREIRKAETFLASDEFAKFAEDPFFRISKDLKDDKHRMIKLPDGTPCKLINATDEERNIIENGHEFSIFRGHLKNKWLTPLTYKIQNKNNTYFIRLSKAGLLQIRKEEELKGNSKELISVLTTLLESQGRYTDNKTTSQKDDILHVAVGFAKLLEFQTVSNFDKEFENRTISPIEIVEAKKKYKNLEREKYTVLFLTKIRKDKSSDSNITPTELDCNFPSAISCILQGSLEIPERSENLRIYQHWKRIQETGLLDKATLHKMLIKIDEKQIDGEGIGRYDSFTLKQKKKVLKELAGFYVIPKISGYKENHYIDLSTWKDELCIFKPERGLIFFDAKKTLESGDKIVEYKEYWKCIVRGIEYTVALRATLQILESRTTRLLDKIPEILSLSTPKENKEFKANNNKAKEKEKKKNFNDAQKMRIEMAEDLASLLKVLPSLRSIAVPTRAFRSGHSVKKFDYLYNDCFNFNEIFNNLQKNIDELTNFLTFLEQQHLQITTEDEAKRVGKEDKKLNIIALLFTATTIIYILPSFVHDFANWDLIKSEGWEFSLNPNAESWFSILYLFILVIILVACQRLWVNPNGWVGKVLKYFFPEKNEIRNDEE